MSENQINNSAVGAVKIDTPVAAYIRNAMVAELQRGGVTVGEGNDPIIGGTINKFRVGDLGFTSEWSLSITFTIVRSGQEVYRNRIDYAESHGKFGEFEDQLNAPISEVLRRFLSDPQVIEILQSA